MEKDFTTGHEGRRVITFLFTPGSNTSETRTRLGLDGPPRISPLVPVLPPSSDVVPHSVWSRWGSRGPSRVFYGRVPRKNKESPKSLHWSPASWRNGVLPWCILSRSDKVSFLSSFVPVSHTNLLLFWREKNPSLGGLTVASLIRPLVPRTYPRRTTTDSEGLCTSFVSTTTVVTGPRRRRDEGSWRNQWGRRIFTSEKLKLDGGGGKLEVIVGTGQQSWPLWFRTRPWFGVPSLSGGWYIPRDTQRTEVSSTPSVSKGDRVLGTRSHHPNGSVWRSQSVSRILFTCLIQTPL